ncbi:MAG: hypothetical protein Kow00104_08200 [Rhodothalassiaceae bacterium]
MSDIVISEFMDEEVVERCFSGKDFRYDPGLVDRPDELRSALADARALIVRNRTRVDAGLLSAAPCLKVVGRLGVGLDNIDLEACKARAIAVHPATGANDDAVAEYVMAAIFALVRPVFTRGADMRAGRWPRLEMIGGEVAGRRLGLVGFGAIARKTAARARALGMKVAAYDPHVDSADPAWQGTERSSLDTLLAQSDIVSLHVPLTPGTRHLIDADAIARMKPGSFLINAARGGVIDERALADALHAGHLGGAALDVFETEPLSEDSGAHLASCPNLLLTPHIAGVSAESNIRVSSMIADRVLAELAHLP